jgi:hypothetical protein
MAKSEDAPRAGADSTAELTRFGWEDWAWRRLSTFVRHISSGITVS